MFKLNPAKSRSFTKLDFVSLVPRNGWMNLPRWVHGFVPERWTGETTSELLSEKQPTKLNWTSSAPRRVRIAIRNLPIDQHRPVWLVRDSRKVFRKVFRLNLAIRMDRLVCNSDSKSLSAVSYLRLSSWENNVERPPKLHKSNKLKKTPESHPQHSDRYIYHFRIFHFNLYCNSGWKRN